jgi:hypothetical protein
MSDNTFFIVEILVFSGAALAWASWELWTVRKSKDEPKDKPAQPGASPREPGHPEG